MNRAEALASLASPEVSVRLDAARVLASVAEREDRPAINAALEREPNRWVRRQLLRAGRFAQDRRSNRRRLVAPTTGVAELTDELFGVAVAGVTELVLHEFNVLIGDIRRHATRELAGPSSPIYADSRTREAIERMDRVAGAIASLNQAASPAAFAQVNIAELLKGAAQMSEDRTSYPVQVIGVDPALAVTDGALLELAVEQALRNASESSISASSNEPVRLSWSIENGVLTVTVQDEGIGLPKGFDHSFRSMRTNKDKREHSGVGLITADRAASSIGGQISLTPRTPRGVEFALVAPV